MHGYMSYTNTALGAVTVFTVIGVIIALGPAFVGFLVIGLLFLGFILGVIQNG